MPGPRCFVGGTTGYGVAAIAPSAWSRPAPTASQATPPQSVSQEIVVKAGAAAR